MSNPNSRPTKPILSNATVFVFDDPLIGGQGLFAVSNEGCLFIQGPGVRAITLCEAEAYFKTFSHELQIAPVIQEISKRIRGEEVH